MKRLLFHPALVVALAGCLQRQDQPIEVNRSTSPSM